jgi:hypothetical protein
LGFLPTNHVAYQDTRADTLLGFEKDADSETIPVGSIEILDCNMMSKTILDDSHNFSCITLQMPCPNENMILFV